MSWTKRQLIEQAYSELGLSSYAFNLTSHELQNAKIRLDSMMKSWESKGIYLGYPTPDEPLGDDLDEDSLIDTNANEAVYTNLAIRIAPTIGKQLNTETRKTGREAYNELLARATIAPDTQYKQGTPSGAGNKRSTFLTCEVVAPVTTVIDLD